MTKRSRRQLTRQWELALLLHEHRAGVGVGRLCRELSVSRSTLYRDLKVLRDAGLPIASRLVNGESRYRLEGRRLPDLGANELQRAALQLARDRLRPLDGTSLAAAVDQLLGEASIHRSFVHIRGLVPAHDRELAAELERAIAEGRRVRALYRPWQRDPRWRVVEPVAFVVYAEQAYLHAWDLDRRAWRTFKLARVERVELGPRSSEHPPYDDERLLRHAVGVWTGDPIDVRLKLDPAFAPHVREWPLHPSQRIERGPNDQVVLTATVAGLEETFRWVLGWGRHVEVLEPSELRELVARELDAALAPYRENPPRSDRVVSRDPKHGSSREESERA